MKVLFAVSAFLFTCILANVEEDIFRRYAGFDRNMSNDEFARFWLSFDIDGNGNVTKSEFDSVWRQQGFGEEDRAPFFFLEMDRVADEVLNRADFDHMFHIFDENADGGITSSEFNFNWKGLFDN